MASGAQTSQKGNPFKIERASRPPTMDSPPGFSRPPKLLDQMCEALRSRHYSRRTEQTYCHWVKRFIYFHHNVRHPAEIPSLMYGAGLRLMECVRLRVQDIDFSRNEILIRGGKGAKDRITMLPHSLKAPLLEHLKEGEKNPRA